MEKCILCQIVKGRLPSKKIYEVNEIIAVLDFNGASAGLTFVMPKEHFTIFEQVPSDIISKTFIAANKVSKTMFETLNIQGTNILVSNGVVAGQRAQHLMVHIIPRKENDGIKVFNVPHKEIDPKELKAISVVLKKRIDEMFGLKHDVLDLDRAKKMAPEQKAGKEGEEQLEEEAEKLFGGEPKKEEEKEKPEEIDIDKIADMFK